MTVPVGTMAGDAPSLVDFRQANPLRSTLRGCFYRAILTGDLLVAADLSRADKEQLVEHWLGADACVRGSPMELLAEVPDVNRRRIMVDNALHTDGERLLAPNRQPAGTGL